VTARAGLEDSARSSVADLAGRGLARTPTSAGGGVDLVSNDYLGLRRDPRVVERAARSLAEAGLGAGGSRALGGDHPEHRALEAEVAAWQGEEAAVLFATGTAANLGVLSTVVRPADFVVSDEANHGSLVDGIRLGGASKAIVPHGDAEAVDRALDRGPSTGRRFVVVEGVHGMEGDRAPLEALAEVCRRRDALLIVDEAHSLGVIGPDGAGAVADARCEDVVAARTNPCGKALGGAGGVVACSASVAALLVQRSRAFLFATALPPAVAAGVAEASRIARAEPWRRERAVGLARRIAAGIEAAGGRVGRVDGAIVPWILGRNDAALRAAESLRAAGFSARAVRPPTVPDGTARIRLSVHAGLTDDDATRLVEAVRRLVAR
jgi:8-amino-7-oxononanoate synthase